MRISDWSSDVCSSDLGAARMVSATRLVSICSMGQKEHKKNIIARGVRPPTLRRMTPPHSNINKSAPIDLSPDEKNLRASLPLTGVVRRNSDQTGSRANGTRDRKSTRLNSSH